MLIGDTHDLSHLGLSNLMVKYATNTLTFRMHLKHDLCRTSPLHSEYSFKDIHNKFHRREIVVYENNTIRGGSFTFGAASSTARSNPS